VRDLLELELDADLVVLTGCETGRHAVDAGEELTGIARAFLAAGARCVVTTLWPVRDAVAIDIATDFHRRLLTKQRPSAALREAMLAARQNTVHPAWWAPFVVLGTL
jgi:CHAT domain-containing protein